jgi:uroporphyrinogen decarboxylase
MSNSPFAVDVSPDWEGLVRCVTRDGVPERVHHIELFLDPEIQNAIVERYGLAEGLQLDEFAGGLELQIRLQRFLGYDFVRCGVEGLEMPLNYGQVDDSFEDLSRGQRTYIDETKGPVTTWEEFEAYPWPDLSQMTTRTMEWYSENLPDDMCIIASGGFAHFAELLTWLAGYETLCFLLYEQPDLVRAIYDKLLEAYRIALARMLEFDRVKLCWGSDDMGYRGGPLISPDQLREWVLPGHKIMAEMSHAAGRPYLLHSCGNLETIMEDLIKDVQIDAKHSFEDVIETPIQAKARWGDRIALLGGIDLDFLCRHDEAAVRQRTRETLEACIPGGGYVLGTGNSVANYIPLDNYLAMVDEGRKFRL